MVQSLSHEVMLKLCEKHPELNSDFQKYRLTKRNYYPLDYIMVLSTKLGRKLHSKMSTDMLSLHLSHTMQRSLKLEIMLKNIVMRFIEDIKEKKRA